MKKHFLPLLAALVLPFACSVIEEPGVAEEQADCETTHLVISANPSGQTKAVLNEDNSVSFVETDALSVFEPLDDQYYTNHSFTVKKLYSDGSADFEGEVGSAGASMPVMYPYQESADIEKSGPARKLKFTIPTEQKAVPGSFDPDAAISLGMTTVGEDGRTSVSLENVCTLVKFTAPLGEYSKVTLNAGTGICGICRVIVNDSGFGNVVISEMDAEVSETVSLTGDITGGNTYFIAVASGEYPKGISVKLYDKGGNLAGDKTTSKTVTFAKGHILNIGLLPTNSPTWDGSGTASDPYIIKTSTHLKLLAQAFSLRETAKPYEGKYFKQDQDINMGREVITIGNYADRYRDTTPAWGVPTAFNANYDGDGHTISNYRLKFINYKLNAHYIAGLFNCVSNATIKNLNISPAKQESGFLIDGLDSTVDYYYIGLLAGEVNGECTISNCHVLSGSYTVSAYDGSGFDASQTVAFGGLVGRTIGPPRKNVTFSNCTNSANLRIEGGINQNIAGGLIGTNFGGTHYQYIDRCRNKGNITVISDKDSSGPEVFAGGIIGRITDDGSDVVFRISNCVNEGTITAKNNSSEDACAGGIAGSNNSDGWLTLSLEAVDPWVYNCLNKGDISASGNDAYSGGIFGYCFDYDTHLALCVNVGRVTAAGDPVVGPICGMKGEQLWCFWLNMDGYVIPAPDYYINCHSCVGFISGNGSGAGTPEYVRLNGKAGDNESGLIWDKTEWSRSQWASAAEWTGLSDSNWDDPYHENTLDLIF